MTIYIFQLLFMGQCIYSNAEKFNSTWVSSQSQLLWFSSLHSYHMGVHKIWATRKNGTTDTLVLCYVNWKWKGLAALIGHSRGFTAACMGGKLAFSGFPPLWEEKTGKIAALPLLSSAVNRTFQFSSPPRGGKLAVAALPLLSSAVKLAFQFASARREGKLEIADMMRVHLAEIIQSDFVSFLPFLCLLVGRGSGLGSTKRRMDMCE